MAMNFDIPVLDTIDTFSGMQEEEASNRSKRLANYEAMKKIGDDFAQQGKAMTVEDMANAANSLLGPSWMNVTNPTSQMISTLQSKQEAAAKIKAEELRRSQLQADENQRKMMEATALERFAAGDTTEDVYASLVDSHGKEWADKLRPNLQRMQQKAIHQISSEGMDFAAKNFDSVDDAVQYISNNTWMSKAEQDAMIKGAQFKEQQAIALVNKEADARGAAGWVGNQQDIDAMKVAIENMFPYSRPEFRQKLLDNATATASAASQRAINKKQVDFAEEVRKSEALNSPIRAKEILTMEESEEKAREQGRARIQQQAMGQLAAQMATAKMFTEEATKNKSEKDRQRLEQMASLLNSYVFDDVQAVQNAVNKGDKEELEKLIKGAQKASDVAASAEALGKIVTGNFSTPDQVISVFRSQGIGVRPEDIAKRGKEIAIQNKIAATTPGTTFGQRAWNTAVDVMSALGESPENTALQRQQFKPGDEIRRTAQATSERMMNDFVVRIADDLKGLRDAMRTNGHITLNANDYQQTEFGLAMERAGQLLQAMGTNNPDARIALAQRILATAGPMEDLKARPYASERYDAAITKARNDMGVNKVGGTLPGAYVPSPRLQQNFR